MSFLQLNFYSITIERGLLLPLSWHEVVWIIHNLREVLNYICVDLIESLRHFSELSNLVSDVLENFLWNFVVREEM